MMVRLPIAFVIFLVVSFGQPIVPPKDVNGWSSAEWGMTEGQITNAFKGEKLSKGKMDNLFIPDFKIGRNRFMIVFVMDEQKKLLNRVNIVPVDEVPGYDGPVINPRPESIYDDVKTLLISKYGQPTNTGATRPGNMAAVWRFKSTTIELDVSTFSIGTFLTLNYRQNAKGDLDKI